MKTAMQLMLEMIESVRRDEPPTALWNLKKYAKDLINKEERDQLINAFNEGTDRITPIEGQQYYNETYNEQ